MQTLHHLSHLPVWFSPRILLRQLLSEGVYRNLWQSSLRYRLLLALLLGISICHQHFFRQIYRLYFKRDYPTDSLALGKWLHLAQVSNNSVPQRYLLGNDFSLNTSIEVTAYSVRYGLFITPVIEGFLFSPRIFITETAGPVAVLLRKQLIFKQIYWSDSIQWQYTVYSADTVR